MGLPMEEQGSDRSDAQTGLVRAWRIVSAPTMGLYMWFDPMTEEPRVFPLHKMDRQARKEWLDARMPDYDRRTEVELQLELFD